VTGAVQAADGKRDAVDTSTVGRMMEDCAEEALRLPQDITSVLCTAPLSVACARRRAMLPRRGTLPGDAQQPLRTDACRAGGGRVVRRIFRMSRRSPWLTAAKAQGAHCWLRAVRSTNIDMQQTMIESAEVARFYDAVAPEPALCGGPRPRRGLYRPGVYADARGGLRLCRQAGITAGRGGSMWGVGRVARRAIWRSSWAAYIGDRYFRCGPCTGRGPAREAGLSHRVQFRCGEYTLSPCACHFDVILGWMPGATSRGEAPCCSAVAHCCALRDVSRCTIMSCGSPCRKEQYRRFCTLVAVPIWKRLQVTSQPCRPLACVSVCRTSPPSMRCGSLHRLLTQYRERRAEFEADRGQTAIRKDRTPAHEPAVGRGGDSRQVVLSPRNRATSEPVPACSCTCSLTQEGAPLAE